MIKLNVEKYCHNCPDFTANVTSYAADVTSYVNNQSEGINYHIITCEHSNRCMQIKKYLEGVKDD
nr:MAG TPA: hypothetical protein [Caudoviricetes sp.]